MTPTDITLIESPSDLSIAWLTTALGGSPVASFSAQRIGTGQMSECYRVTLDYADAGRGPASVVLKVAASDATSRQTGLALGLYEREVRFYTDIAPGLGGPVAPCYHAAFDADSGAFDLLLGDAIPAEMGNEIRGANVEQATVSMAELARLHAPLLGDTALAQAQWLNRDSPVTQGLISALYAGFVGRYGDAISPEQRIVCEALVGSFDAYLAGAAAAGVQGLVHGDYRLDNLLFGQPGADRPLTVVDWQTVTRGPALTDVAYFLGCALRVDDRRAHYDALLRAYHDGLGAEPAITRDDVRHGVRHQSFFGVIMAIISSMLVERTDRGDEMFMTMLERHCQHVLDTDALALLPAAVAPSPLVVSADDEVAHPASGEPLWSESWYCDFVDPDQGVGGWVRLGLIPNQKTAWFNALLCGLEMPTIAVNEFDAPLPADFSALRTGTTDFTHCITEGLRTYRLGLRGRGQAYDDPADLLSGGLGHPVDLSMELVFETAGTPYQYRVTPRYEIPCTVSGTVVAGGRTFALSGAPGQRDHSWGVRDWWSMDWVWSALHLDDGTHIHALDLRIPGAPPIGIGYIQQDGSELVELEAASAREEFGDNGLPRGTELTLNPGHLTATIDIRGHAPVSLVSGDGRVSHFPRAWATVITSDGRAGVGWMEWNRNQSG